MEPTEEFDLVSDDERTFIAEQLLLELDRDEAAGSADGVGRRDDDNPAPRRP